MIDCYHQVGIWLRNRLVTAKKSTDEKWGNWFQSISTDSRILIGSSLNSQQMYSSYYWLAIIYSWSWFLTFVVVVGHFYIDQRWMRLWTLCRVFLSLFVLPAEGKYWHRDRKKISLDRLDLALTSLILLVLLFFFFFKFSFFFSLFLLPLLLSLCLFFPLFLLFLLSLFTMAFAWKAKTWSSGHTVTILDDWLTSNKQTRTNNSATKVEKKDWWKRMKEDRKCCKRMKEDERRCKWMKEDGRGWKRQEEDERVWKSMKEYERGWKRTKEDERRWKRMNIRNIWNIMKIMNNMNLMKIMNTMNIMNILNILNIISIINI